MKQICFLSLAAIVCGLGVCACSNDAPAPPPAASAPAATTSAAAADFGNTKCMVMGDDIGTATTEYDGKIYHFCCPSCIPEFKKDPDKFIKAALADPAKYGLKK